MGAVQLELFLVICSIQSSDKISHLSLEHNPFCLFAGKKLVIKLLEITISL